MEITVITAKDQPANLLVVGIWKDEGLPEELRGLAEPGAFTGAFKKVATLNLPEAAQQTYGARRLLLVGLGLRAKFTPDRSRSLIAVAAQHARELRYSTFRTILLGRERLDAFVSARAVAEGLLLGLYRFDKYKTLDEPELDPLTIVERIEVVASVEDEPAVSQAVALAQAEMAGVELARNLGNEPPMVVTPTRLAEEAQAIAERYGMQATIYERSHMEKLGMGGMLGVSRGSNEPPRFIVVEHGQKRDGVPTVVLVGKGITFDTGGISLKPADNMDKMKMDMMGAAAVLGTLEVVGRLQLPLHIVGIVPSTENTPSGTAYKPGDVLRALNGVTMEVLNTDAEGRLVLADGLSYAQRYQPDAIIDLATLTGAMVVALGNHGSGVMGNNPALIQRIKQAAETTGEKTWEMPMWGEYKEQIKSDVADIKNIGGRNGGALTAGAFLSYFVGEYPWAHLDIAGVAWTEDLPKPYTPKGATGYGVRLLVELLRSWAEELLHS